MALAAHLAFGVSAFLYQGTQLYDTPAAAALLSKWSAFFKAFRPLLATGDLVHIARPSGQTLDAVLHAKSGLAVPGLLVVFNPTDEDITTSLEVPLYYTGLTGASAEVVWEPWPGQAASASASAPAPSAGPPLRADTVALDWRRRAAVNVTVPARAMTWATIAASASS